MKHLSRRTMLAGAAALTPILTPTLARAADVKAALGTPPSVISNPPRDFGPHAPPLSNPDPDVLVLDRSFGGMLVGGNFASTLNIIFGFLFLLSGFANLAVLDTGVNFLAFRMPNVIFSFVVGLMLLTFGMYGRVGGALPHDNPYWRGRHPGLAEREAAALSARTQRQIPGAGQGPADPAPGGRS